MCNDWKAIFSGKRPRPHRSDELFYGSHHILHRHERHFEIDLGELRLSIRPAAFVTIAPSNLKKI